MEGKEGAARRVIVLSLITAACLIGDSMLYIVLPVHFAEAGLGSLWEVGIILSANRLVRLPLNPAVGWLYRRISDRTGIVVATVLATLTTLGYAWADGFFMWLALRCVWGAAWTLLRLGAFYCILNVSSDGDRGYFMGLYNGLYRLGSLGGMLAGGLLADLLGFSATALLFGACTALTIVPSLVFVPHGKGPQSASVPGAPSEAVAWKDGAVLWVMATGLVVALIYQGLYASTLSRLINVHAGSSVAVWGIAVGAATLAGVLQALRWAWEPWLAPWFGRLSDGRFGRRAVMAASLGAGAAFFGLAALTLPLPLWIGALLGAQLAGTSLTTCADAVASDAASVAGGRTFMMWYSFAVDLGAALGPLMAYRINDLWGMDAAYAATAGLLLLFALKWFRAAPVGAGVSSRREG